MAQLKDLIVTGSSRFLNDINGNTTSADQVNNDLTIQLNGGTTEGTNKFTFNGSTAKSLNITASSIGAGTGTVTSVKVGTTSYSPSSGVVSLPAYPTTLPASDTTSTYSASGTVPVNGTAVASALGTLDGTVSGSAGASKTLTAFSQTDGKVSATFGNISITKSQVSDFPTLGTASAKDVPSSGNASTTQVVMGSDTRLSDARTPTSHTHGNIQNGGTLQTSDITIANGDKLVVTDSSDSSKVARASISFDGSTATKALTQKGTWETFGTSNLAIGTTSTTAMAGNTNVNNVTQTAVAPGSGTSYYTLPFSKSNNSTTESDGLYKNIGITVGLNTYATNIVLGDPGTNPSDTLYGLGLSSRNITLMSRASATSAPDNMIEITPSDITFNGSSLKTMVSNAGTTVTQTATTTDASYEVLFSNSANDTTETAGVRKDSKLTYNPYDGVLYMFDQGKSITMAPGSIGVSQAGNSTVSITQSEISINSYPGNSISLSATGLIGDVTGNVTGNLNGNVKQSATSTSTNSNYPILFSGSTSTSSGQYGINRQAKLTYNPSTNVINLNNDGYMHFRTGSDDNNGYVDIGSGGIGAINSDDTGILIARSDNNGGDITLIGTDNTWDGTNTSLKNAISSLFTRVGNVGTLLSGSGSITSTATGAAVTSITIPKGSGLWLILGCTRRSTSDTSKSYQTSIFTTSGYISGGFGSRPVIDKGTGSILGQITFQVTSASSSANTTWYLNVSSGSSVTCEGVLYGIRLTV